RVACLGFLVPSFREIEVAARTPGNRLRAAPLGGRTTATTGSPSLDATKPLRFLGAGRQFGHQSQRDRQLIELEMWPDEGHGAVDTGLARHFRNVDGGLAQRVLRLGFLVCIVVKQYVLGDPPIEEILHVAGGCEAS